MPQRKTTSAAGLVLAVLILLALRENFLPAPSDPTATAALPTEQGRCVWVVDGDTLDVKIAGRKERVRLLGIDTMDAHNQDKAGRQARAHGVSLRQIEALSHRATSRVIALAKNRDVVLRSVPDGDNRDPYGRLLRYVEVGGNDLGAILLGEGLAEARREPHPRIQHYRQIARALDF